MRTLVAVACLLSAVELSSAADAPRDPGSSTFGTEASDLLELRLRNAIADSLDTRRAKFLEIKSRSSFIILIQKAVQILESK